jgi:drug/metabolite transporter (DMT)-like permease
VILLEPWMTGERGNTTDSGSVIAVTVGLLLVVPEYRLDSDATIGLLWAVLSGLLFAVLALVNRRLARYGAVRVALWQNVGATLLLAPFSWPLLTHTPLLDWGRLLVLGVVFTALAHGLFIGSLRSVPARLAAVVAALEPVYGILFAWLLFSEWPPIRTLAGGSVILVATTWVSLHRRKPKRKL